MTLALCPRPLPSPCRSSPNCPSTSPSLLRLFREARRQCTSKTVSHDSSLVGFPSLTAVSCTSSPVASKQVSSTAGKYYCRLFSMLTNCILLGCTLLNMSQAIQATLTRVTSRMSSKLHGLTGPVTASTATSPATSLLRHSSAPAFLKSVLSL